MKSRLQILVTTLATLVAGYALLVAIRARSGTTSVGDDILVGMFVTPLMLLAGAIFIRKLNGAGLPAFAALSLSLPLFAFLGWTGLVWHGKVMSHAELMEKNRAIAVPP